MTIREATVADAPQVVAMGLRFARQGPYREDAGEATAERIEVLCETVMRLGVVLVAERDGPLVGFVALAVLPHPVTGEAYADEQAWWVEPDARHGRVGVHLLDAAEAWAADRGLALKMVEPAGSEMGAFYAARGYARVETAWLRRLCGETLRAGRDGRAV